VRTYKATPHGQAQLTAKCQGKVDNMKFTEEKLQQAVIELFEAEKIL